MAGHDDSPWHGLDKRVSIVETRIDFHDAEIKKMTAVLNTIMEKVDENTRMNRESAAMITNSIIEHERREEAKAAERHKEQRQIDISSRRWTISTLVSICIAIAGWILHSRGII